MPAERPTISPSPAPERPEALLAHLHALADTLAGAPTPQERLRLRALIQSTIRVHRESRIDHPVLALLLRNLLTDLWAEHVDSLYYAQQIALVADALGA